MAALSVQTLTTVDLVRSYQHSRRSAVLSYLAGQLQDPYARAGSYVAETRGFPKRRCDAWMQQESDVGLPYFVLSVQSGRLGFVSREAVAIDDGRTFVGRRTWLG